MASSITKVSNTAYTDLGTGPLQIQALDFDIFLVVASSLPAATAIGFVLSAGDEMPDFTLSTTSHIYARAVSSYGANVAVSPTT
jgi:hypothetical protein